MEEVLGMLISPMPWHGPGSEAMEGSSGYKHPCVCVPLFFRRENWTWLRDAWKAGVLVPHVCSATTLELIRVLNYPKFNLDPPAQKLILEEML